LTYKEDAFIYLKSRDDTAVNELIDNLREIYHFVRQFASVFHLSPQFPLWLH